MKKINSAFIILFITIILSNIFYAQSNDNLNYFPHNDGDMWEYFYSDGPFYTDTAQVFNYYDSTDADGNIFITQTSRYINPIEIPATPFPDTIQYKIDTLDQVWAHFGQVEYGIAFKLNAKQGDKWILKTYYDSNKVQGYEMARIGTIYEKNYFGKTYTIMNTYYYFATDTTDTLGLVRYGQDLAKGLGCVWLGGGDTPGEMNLRGAVVEGILYGDTTSVITSVKDYYSNNLPSTIFLDQNYPNPFNPTTKISYQLPAKGHVVLKVYNTLGKEIATLENSNKEAGNYTVDFDASNLPSGLYLYKLQVYDSGNTIKFTKVRKMMLIK